jgi:hypothetical protein
MAHRVRGVMAGVGALVMVGLLSIPSVAADKSNPSRSSTSSPSYQTKSSSSYQPKSSTSYQPYEPKSSPPPMHQQFDKSAPKSTPSNAKTQGSDAKPVEAKLPPDLKAALGGGKGSALSQVFNPQVRRPPAAVPQQPKKTTNSGNGGGGTSADASGGNRMPRGLTAQSKPPAPPTR